MTKKLKEYKISLGVIAKGIIYTYKDEPNIAYFRNIEVSKDMRGRGWGGTLLEVMERTSIQLGCNEFILKVSRNTDNHQWYKRKGYTDYAPDMDDNTYIWMRKK